MNFVNDRTVLPLKKLNMPERIEGPRSKLPNKIVKARKNTLGTGRNLSLYRQGQT